MGFFDSFKKASTIYDFLMLVKKENGSELIIMPDRAPQLLVKGRLRPLADNSLEEGQARDLCYTLFTAEQKAEFERNGKIEFALGVKGIGRINAEIVSVEGQVSGKFKVLGHT